MQNDEEIFLSFLLMANRRENEERLDLGKMLSISSRDCFFHTNVRNEESLFFSDKEKMFAVLM